MGRILHAKDQDACQLNLRHLAGGIVGEEQGLKCGEGLGEYSREKVGYENGTISDADGASTF